MADVIRAGNLSIDRSSYTVWVNNEPVPLTYIEFELLVALARNRGRVLSQQEILESVWGRDDATDSRKLAVHISRLRNKISASRPWSIRTVTKRGYALATASAEPRTAISGGRPLTPSPSSRGLVGG